MNTSNFIDLFRCLTPAEKMDLLTYLTIEKESEDTQARSASFQQKEKKTTE